MWDFESMIFGQEFQPFNRKKIQSIWWIDVFAPVPQDPYIEPGQRRAGNKQSAGLKRLSSIDDKDSGAIMVAAAIAKGPLRGRRLSNSN